MSNSFRLSQLFTFSVLVRLIAAGLLFYALQRHRYSYYMILRWVVFSVGIYLSFIAYQEKSLGWLCAIGFIAALFNPFLQVRLNRDTWASLDIIAGAILLISIWFVPDRSNKSMKN